MTLAGQKAKRLGDSFQDAFLFDFKLAKPGLF